MIFSFLVCFISSIIHFREVKSENSNIDFYKCVKSKKKHSFHDELVRINNAKVYLMMYERKAKDNIVLEIFVQMLWNDEEVHIYIASNASFDNAKQLRINQDSKSFQISL